MNKGNLFSTLNNIEKEGFSKSLRKKILDYKEQLDVSSCPGLLMVKNGTLRVFLISENGREITLFHLKDDEVCIMSSPCLIGSSSFNIFIEAVTTSTIEIVPKIIVENTKNNNLVFSNLLISLIGEKMGLVLKLIDDLLVKKIDARIADLLISCTNINNLSHEDIANHIGSSREVVSRVLKHMQKDELIELKRRSITIKNLERLKSLSLSN